jgi:hypothetical protein
MDIIFLCLAIGLIINLIILRLFYLKVKSTVFLDWFLPAMIPICAIIGLIIKIYVK